MHANTPERGDRWYHEGWAWFVFSIPAISVPLGIAMIVLSLNTNNALVVDDYYVQGKTINQRIDRDRYATRNGISAAVTALGNRLEITVTADTDIAMPDTLLLRWIHVTEADLDGALQLTRSGPTNQYQATLIDAGPATPWTQQSGQRYRIHLHPDSEQWRLVSAPIKIDNRPGTDLLLTHRKDKAIGEATE
jgi:hypothetical protein